MFIYVLFWLGPFFSPIILGSIYSQSIMFFTLITFSGCFFSKEFIEFCSKTEIVIKDLSAPSIFLILVFATLLKPISFYYLNVFILETPQINETPYIAKSLSKSLSDASPEKRRSGAVSVYMFTGQKIYYLNENELAVRYIPNEEISDLYSEDVVIQNDMEITTNQAKKSSLLWFYLSISGICYFVLVFIFSSFICKRKANKPIKKD